MQLILARIFSGDDSTVGVLGVDDKPFCFACEDEKRLVKVHGETRIPTGTYEIKYRDAGSMVTRYRDRYPWHKGMLHLQDVPGFEFIYIHIGNTDADTLGCILVGNGATLNGAGGGSISHSRDAYAALYKTIARALDNDEKVEITVLDNAESYKQQYSRA